LPSNPIVDFGIFLIVYKDENELYLHALAISDESAFLNGATLTFYYNSYLTSNLNMLPAPLRLDFDFSDSVSMLNLEDREKIYNSLRVGRIVLVKYKGNTV
jgi:hypothetical protein